MFVCNFGVSISGCDLCDIRRDIRRNSLCAGTATHDRPLCDRAMNKETKNRKNIFERALSTYRLSPSERLWFIFHSLSWESNEFSSTKCPRAQGNCSLQLAW